MIKIRTVGNESAVVAKTVYRNLKTHPPVLRDIDADILIITSNAHPPFSVCKILIIPDELFSIPKADIAISYGMSPKCSITLSSVDKQPILAVQREITTLGGKSIEPQEIPLRNDLGLSKYALMASSACLLTLGISPESLS